MEGSGQVSLFGVITDWANQRKGDSDKKEVMS